MFGAQKKKIPNKTSEVKMFIKREKVHTNAFMNM